MLQFLMMLIVLPSLLLARNSSRTLTDQMLDDLKTIYNTFDIKYAPADWKKEHHQWDLDLSYLKAQQEILQSGPLTLKHYQNILSRFLRSTLDYHVNIRFHSTEEASLPFQIMGAEGRYFIVDRDKNLIPCELGDELIEFDGKPIAEVIETLRTDGIRGNHQTDLCIAQIALTHRSGRSGIAVPSGTVNIKLKSKKEGLISSHDLLWNYSPEQVTAPKFKMAAPMALSFNKNRSERSMYADLQLDGLSPFSLGSPEGFLPYLGEPIWIASEELFKAYIYEYSGKRIGYVRIPDYRSKMDHLYSFERIIRQFEAETDALVIDQLNNPGGSVMYLYSLASMLTEHPLAVPSHRFSITQKEVLSAVQFLKETEKLKSDDEFKAYATKQFDDGFVTSEIIHSMIKESAFKIAEWNAGRHFTEHSYIYGMDYVNSHKTFYSKPMMILINHLDISGGDFFPAIMQDNRRATIFGSRTAGAGGCVLKESFPNHFGIDFYSYTTTIAARTNPENLPLEDLGVTPDISCDFTTDDMQYNFRDYVKAVNEAIRGLLQE